MIRREVRFADGVPQWLLISQVEHARLSGELAGRCITRFGGSRNSLTDVRHELLQAITHHDDGWREWEIQPRLDSEWGRPLSFLELPLDESLEIWSRSIESALEIGELAAWVVAGHFSALLATVGHHATEAHARSWLRDLATRRSEWFTNWYSRNKLLHTAELAGEALKWLQLFDILSLWPCSQYPVKGEQGSDCPHPFLNVENWTLVREIRPEFQLADGKPCRILFKPWPFDEPQILLKAAASLVPVRHYTSSPELMAARNPLTAEWVLTSASG